jgi:hypothetical protein
MGPVITRPVVAYYEEGCGKREWNLRETQIGQKIGVKAKNANPRRKERIFRRQTVTGRPVNRENEDTEDDEVGDSQPSANNDGIIGPD